MRGRFVILSIGVAVYSLGSGAAPLTTVLLHVPFIHTDALALPSTHPALNE